MDRREFFNSAGRWSLLGSLMTVCGFLWVNNRIEQNQSCTYSPICKKCKEFSFCDRVPNTKSKGNG